jgi:hypothetical protein
MSAPVPARTPIEHFRLVDCTLLITPPVRGRDLKESVERAILQGFRAGADLDQVIEGALQDRGEGSLYRQVASQIEDSKRAQRANAIRDAENAHATQIEVVDLTYTARTQEVTETAAADQEQHRIRMEEARERAQSVRKHRSAVEARLEAFRERIGVQVDENERAELEAIIAINRKVLGNDALEDVAKSIEAILKNDMKRYARTEFGISLAQALEYTPRMERDDFTKYRDGIMALERPSTIRRAYQTVRNFLGI